MNQPPPTPPPEDTLRPHVYDGIREFDKRLPNWWLNTLYGAIVFSVGYWTYFEWFRVGLTGPQEVEQQLAQVEAIKLAASANNQIDDATLWQMSRNAAFVDAGKLTFQSTCASCHLASLKGKTENPAAVGPDLTDQLWVHGGNPLDLYNTVTKGVLEKGMPTWGPVLGQKKITELVAYVMSHHREGEPIMAAPPAAPPP